jgi:hypothetical protein
VYKLIGMSRDGSRTSGIVTARSAIEANVAQIGLRRDGYIKVKIIDLNGRELSWQEFFEVLKDEELRK